MSTVPVVPAASPAARGPGERVGFGAGAGSGSYVGRVLARTYRLDRLLVAGGIGSVYLARHLRTGGPCAVKVLHRESAQNHELYRRFLDEARVTVALRHPHIVQVTDLDQTEDGTPFLVMELLEGEDLQARLDREWRLPLAQVLIMAQQVGAALHAAHLQGVVHRDLKPQNIFLTRIELSGRQAEIAKVVDFGLSKIPRAGEPAAQPMPDEARRSAGERPTRDLLVIGTPRYLCPEAAQGQNSQIDGRADQWSLAVILYRALSGRLPFESDDITEVLRRVVYQQEVPLQQLAPDVPLGVARAIHQALSKRKEDRYPTMRAFIHALLGPAATGLALSSSLDTGQVQALLATSVTQSGAHVALLSGAQRVVPPPPPRGRRRRLRGRRLWGAVALSAALSCLVVMAGVRALRAPAAPEQAGQGRGPASDPRQASLAAAGASVTGRGRGEAAAALVSRGLEQAREARGRGDCRRMATAAREVLTVLPGQREALLLLLSGCGEAWSTTAGGATRYPSLRPVLADEGAGAAALEGDRASGAAQLWEQARLAFGQGRDRRAMALAHLAMAAGGRLRGAAWGLYALAACHQGDERRVRWASAEQRATVVPAGLTTAELLPLGCAAGGDGAP